MLQLADYSPSPNVPLVTDLFLRLYQIWPHHLVPIPLRWPHGGKELLGQKYARDVLHARYATLARKPHTNVPFGVLNLALGVPLLSNLLYLISPPSLITFKLRHSHHVAPYASPIVCHHERKLIFPYRYVESNATRRSPVVSLASCGFPPTRWWFLHMHRCKMHINREKV